MALKENEGVVPVETKEKIADVVIMCNGFGLIAIIICTVLKFLRGLYKIYNAVKKEKWKGKELFFNLLLLPFGHSGMEIAAI